MNLRRIATVVVVLLGAAAAAFVGANAWDYFRFHAAIWRVEGLSEEQYRALGDAAAHVKDHVRTKDPEGFELLKPIRASLYPGSSDFLLYELRPTEPRYEDDHIYLYARISTSPNNQVILYFTNSEEKQRSKVVWNRNPEFVKRHSPAGRILTITQWNRDGRSWIVLPDHILVIDENGYVGGEPSIAGTVALDEAGIARIQDAMNKIPASMRGKDYRADGVLDGINLNILFDSEGKEGSDTISISNTWVEEFRPLLTAVSELSPADCPIHFIEYMTTEAHLRDYPTTVRTREEWDKILWSEPNTPWWCVWRRWLD
jgi:hypothetical protein